MVADSAETAPDAIVAGSGAPAVTESVCFTGCTVTEVDPIPLVGMGPLQVTVTVSVTI
jgi:hypothetical protein